MVGLLRRCWFRNGVILVAMACCVPSAELCRAEQPHWAFRPIAKPEVPDVARPGQVLNGIDRFILKRLAVENVRPAPPADPATLLRRIHLDLTGLPPQPGLVKSFLADPTREAYREIVRRLLASSHYGERWGRFWLDMARYGDSNGYESDGIRPHAWRYRQWVIEALNRDLPFDRFTVEQLAGDLLPDATRDQRIATGFHRNTLVNTEGGVDREEDRVKRTVDRTNTLGKVWLGITLGCCQCHDHKFDVFSQDDYFGVYAFFNSLDEPLITVQTEQESAIFREQLEAYRVRRAKLLKAVAAFRSETFTRWEKHVLRPQAGWEVLRPRELVGSAGSKLTVEEDFSVLATGPNSQAETYTIRATADTKTIRAIRLQVLADERLPSRGPGRASNGNFVLSSLRIFVESQKANSVARRHRLASARADFSQNSRQVTSVLGDDATDGWAIHPRVGQDHVAVFSLRQPIVANGGPVRLRVELDHRVHEDHNIGRFQLSVSSAQVPLLQKVPDTGLLTTLKTPPGKRTGEQVLKLIRFFGYREPELDTRVAAVDRNDKTKPSVGELPKARAVVERRPLRETRLHHRGDFLDKGHVVRRATPADLPPLTSRGQVPDRLDLARWLVSRDNPLTARVIVNRVWQQYFGRGIVPTDDDFGSQGQRPSHPRLLDWLAFRFADPDDGAWRLKWLHELIVTSSTYRQSSKTRPELGERDPYNSWLARQNRLRVEGEIVRDLALSVSGLLDPRIGGPSVRPPQPADLVKLGFQNSLAWKVSTGGDRYRRGLYTFFQRTVPYPMLVTFDVPDSNSACTHRERSNTPLQALTLWNDPVFVECAQRLGRRLVDSVPMVAGIDQRTRLVVDRAVRLGLGREAGRIEHRVLGDLFRDNLERYWADELSARQVAGPGKWPHTASLAEVAAAVGVARVILNLDEFITRE
ncbi:MAG: hypothetical protein CMJ69_04340 [Planctomycetaceae bacterium]|nr:hypothetical protein [Planctomycetaceae bacterium]